ncbi:hypothetical protein [Paenibacillus wynnii]|uniref:Uncharacterized protein n=1 Tax=Paenibacillus wynnii TaxID=268407 RepID=A0A098MGW7_9BACL|nr:hypothetical protein [Paenibacillus wynnii]KGE20792.1 hypothetical protein PWYN_01020 [Paenibacillus wynnii]
MSKKEEGKKMGMVLRKSSTFNPAALKRTSKSNDEILSVNEIRKILGFDKIEPIKITYADAQSLEENEDYFEGWYEDELRKFFGEK